MASANPFTRRLPPRPAPAGAPDTRQHGRALLDGAPWPASTPPSSLRSPTSSGTTSSGLRAPSRRCRRPSCCPSSSSSSSQGSGSDDDGRREVRGLDGVVAADVQRSEAAARSLPLSPQHTECGEWGTCTMASSVRWW
ncbi:uncharacterized protein LOC119272267 [Triticum dicoccoides]|uniref:uncharacterized protein LOC119272267 n=1 Tax=Triticum dicoccoides TaxID=85692 RepID=UPI00188ED404|nr:uncharacterized protein LOC119272267 [Triticum dicoccoides]